MQVGVTDDMEEQLGDVHERSRVMPASRSMCCSGIQYLQRAGVHAAAACLCKLGLLRENPLVAQLVSRDAS